MTGQEPREPRWPTVEELTLESRRWDEILGHAIDELQWQVMALEEILAARWPRSVLVKYRLRRDIRASVRHSEGDGFGARRFNSIGTGWLTQDRSEGEH
jgi:hypothetical protein